MSKHDPIPPTTDTPRTEPATERVPYFARKAGRPALIVRSGVHGGKEADKKAI